MTSRTLRQYIHSMPSQGNVDCCTSSATLLAAEILLYSKGIRKDFSRLFLYYMTRAEQGRPGQKGADLTTTMECFRKYGVSDSKLWPFLDRNVETEPSMQAKVNATTNRLMSYNEITCADYRHCIDSGLPIVAGLHTGKIFWTLKGPLAEQAYKPINNSDNRISKGHAVTIVGYDDSINGGSWIISNSKGPRWGFVGFGAIPYECNSNFGESFVITEVNCHHGRNISVSDK